MTRVVIVDDHPIVRTGMQTILAHTDDITVVAQGASGVDAFHLVTECHPDVLVLDVNLPDVDGIQVTRQLRAQGMTLAILILTVHSDQQTIFGLLEAGATGYVLKDDALETLVSAVRAVARGETWLSPGVAKQVVQRAVRSTQPGLECPRDPQGLTPRELEVLRLLAQSLDNAAIAQKLVLTTRTVQNHVSQIYDKLGVTTRTQAMMYAIRQGLVKLPPPEKSSHES
jgi:DNA-binding NarL/FixJ family response regulator